MRHGGGERHSDAGVDRARPRDSSAQAARGTGQTFVEGLDRARLEHQNPGSGIWARLPDLRSTAGSDGGGELVAAAGSAGRDDVPPVGVLDPGGVRLGEELGEDRREPLGVFEVGEVGGGGEAPKAAAGGGAVGGQAVGEGDRVVALSPHEQGGHAGEQVQAVLGGDPLAVDVDDRAEGVKEGLAGAGLLQGTQGPGEGLHVDALAGPGLAHAVAEAADAGEQAGVGGEGQQTGGAGEGGGAQQRADLAAEAAAGDQHEAVGALGELVEELHRHAPAEGVADDRGALHPEHREQVADARGVGAEGVVTARGRGVPVSDQVRRDHGVTVGERQGHRLPVAGGVEHPVDQHHRGPGSGHVVDNPVAVELDLPGLEVVGVVGR